MQDPQPSLPFDENDRLEEIRRLLEIQNTLLQLLVERLNPVCEGELEGDDLYELLVEDDVIEEVWDEEDPLPEPPEWFARIYGS